ncbi:hypothetical protein FFI89_021285 [Bradyrhizobium sp. KBS0727]|nr:hypothetical protein FFI71_021290 [Bradyrhizobium sp. KBS0725]QDW46051.1 hypothetical protein FFI89_021285 [Bradyrhizobium sp. KBS0727]
MNQQPAAMTVHRRAVADAMAMKMVKSTIVPWPELAVALRTARSRPVRRIGAGWAICRATRCATCVEALKLRSAIVPRSKLVRR